MWRVVMQPKEGGVPPIQFLTGTITVHQLGNLAASQFFTYVQVFNSQDQSVFYCDSVVPE